MLKDKIFLQFSPKLHSAKHTYILETFLTNYTMVLHKNKWDHRAKISYLKKHGLTRGKQQQQITPKWSSKKTSETKRAVYLDDSEDSDWDSEDEALINHFYPEIAEQNISVEHKVKIKRQIINGLRQKEAEMFGSEDGENQVEEEEEEDEMGGIYLGTEPQEEFELPDLESKLSDFVITDLAKSTKNRKVLRSKILDTLLEDYGISSYKDTVKSTDYNDLKKDTKDVDRMTANDLHGFRIGQTDPKESQNIRTLTEEELKEHTDRSKKLESAKLYEQMKKKFGDSVAKRKVLEINNFNADDERQMQVLNLKLTQTTDKITLDEDLDLLLGPHNHSVTAQTINSLDLDDLLKQAAVDEKNKDELKNEKKVNVVAPRQDEDFLDDLLG